MPKVTEAHIEARRHQILEAARTCFSRQGFHQTTVQDICKEAGLSPGAVYRYFPSKDHIIAATCLRKNDGGRLPPRRDSHDSGPLAVISGPKRGASPPQKLQYPVFWGTAQRT